jgi:hypothetical protein
MFQGVMFGSGPVASMVREVNDQLRAELYVSDPDDLAAMARVQDQITDQIARDNPSFLSEFARAARSGDPAKVQAMLARASAAVSQAAAVQQLGREPNIPMAVREPNIPMAAREPNIPMAAREPNIPMARREPNIPMGRHEPNIPMGRHEPNIPIGRHEPNIPVASREPNIPVAYVRVHPAWSLLSSRLFTEQLAGSVANTFAQSSAER